MFFRKDIKRLEVMVRDMHTKELVLQKRHGNRTPGSARSVNNQNAQALSRILAEILNQ